MRRARANHCNFGSPWRKKSLVGVGDEGQRYKVTYRDGAGTPRTFGYAGTIEGAETMVKSIRLHPSWCKPKIVDREDRG